MIPPGDISQRFLNTNFFAQESKQLNLTPDFAQQFKQIVQDLVGQFEDDVNATSIGFVSFLQQSKATNLPEKDIMQALNKAQGDINQTCKQFITDIKSRLLDKVGPDFTHAIEQFVEDIQKKIAPITNLEAKVRSDPELNQMMPARSIFELKPSTQQTLQKYISQVKVWKSNFPQSSGQAQFADKLLAILTPLVKQTSPPTVDELIASIKQQLIQPENPQSIYTRFPGLNQAQANTVLHIFDSSFDAPPTQKGHERLLSAIESWISKYAPTSSQTAFAQQITAIIHHVTEQFPHPSHAQIVQAIRQQLFENNQDVYQKFPGLTPQQVKSMSDLFGQALPVPAVSQMDKIYLHGLKALQTPNLTENDRSLLETLVQKIGDLGSADTHLPELIDWVNKLKGTEDFLAASKGAQHVVSALVTTPTPSKKVGETDLQKYTESINNWESQYPKGSPQYQLAEAIKEKLQEMDPNASLQDIIGEIDKEIYSDNKNPQDVYMRFSGVTQDQLQGLAKLLTDGKTSLDVPTETIMDQKFAAAQKWLNTRGLSANDQALAQQLSEEMKNLGSSDTNLAQLQAWGVNMTASSTGAYSKASSATNEGQSQFATILGIPQRTPNIPSTANQPSEGPDAGGLPFFKMIERSQAIRMAMEFSIENLISMTAQESKVSVMPHYIQQVANQLMDTSHLHIAGYSPNQTVGEGKPPAQPLQTNAWWTLLADDRGAGSLSLTVVSNDTTITNPKAQIPLNDAQMFDSGAQIGQPITISYNLADNFNPNVNQGGYNVQSYDGGFAFNPSEQYQVVSNGTSAYAQNTPYLMVAGAKENLIFPPTVVGSDDNSVSLVYQTRTGGTMTVPLVRGSPYLTFQYQNATPNFNTTAYPIDMSSILAYFYKKVVADVTDPNTQISVADAKALGLDSTIGHVDLVRNTDGPPWEGKQLRGQVFSYKTLDSGTTIGDTYRLYFSSPVTLNPCDYVTETVVPENVPLSDNYVHPDPNDPPDLQKPYATKQVNMYGTAGSVATGLEASGPFTGTARIIKVPTSASTNAGGSSLLNATLQEINSIIARGGNIGDLRLWAASLLSDQNFLQDYPNITANEFSEFCSLTGTSQMDAENRIAAKWQALSMGGSQNWQKIANQLTQLTNSPGGNATTVQNWLNSVINGQDPTFSPIYKSLDPSQQQFLQNFAKFGASNLTPEENLDKATALTDYQNTNPDPLTNTINIFDADAWNVPLSGHYTSTGLGKWSYTYTVDDTVNPYAGLGLTYTPGNVLIGLLKTDFSYLSGTSALSPQSYSYMETIKGELEFAETSNNQLNFYDSDATLSWPDDDLSKLSDQDQIDLANKYLNEVMPNLYLNDRHLNESTYGAAKDIQNAADIAHALWKLASFSSIQNAPDGKLEQAVTSAAKQAAHIAEAGLDDFLTGGLLEYDKTNGMIISKFGQSQEGEDYNNANGEDHHFAYGYLIRAAAEIRQVDPTWFQDPKWGTQRTQMVNFLVDDVFNVQNDPNFPRMRMWDAYIGIGRATGLVYPSGNGMNEESTAEDYNCIQGIAMWAQTDGNMDLANQAATMAERVKNAAQAYWQTQSSTSIYTDEYAPEAAKEFASKVVTCGINWDNEASSATFFLPSANADPNIYALAIESITGNSKLIDYSQALAAFNYLTGNDSSGYPRIFQYNMQPPNPSFTTYIPILIPLIAQVSPTLAKELLKWFQNACQAQPSIYMYDSGCNYATIYQQILIAGKNIDGHKDPLAPPASLPTFPPLPAPSPYPANPIVTLNGTARYYLSPWIPPDGDFAKVMPLIQAQALLPGETPALLKQWITNVILPKFPGLHVGDFLNLYYVYTHLSPDGRAMMAAFQAQTDKMIAAKDFSMPALQEWLRTDFLPTAREKYPNLNSFDIETFCKMAQIDIHSFDAPTLSEDPIQQDINQVSALMKDPNLKPQDLPLLQYLYNELISLRGTGNSLEALQNWAQRIINGEAGIFKYATSSTKAFFLKITGAVSNDPLQTYIERLDALEASLDPKSGAYQLIEAIKAIIVSLEGTPQDTLQNVINLIHAHFYGGKTDVYINFDITQQTMQTICSKLTDGNIALDVPPFTQMDNLFLQASDWLYTPNLKGPDVTLARALFYEIYDLGSSDTNLQTFMNWATQVIKGPAPFYSAASADAQALFAKIVNINANPLQTYIDNINNLEKILDPKSTQYAFAEMLKSLIQSLDKPGATLQDVINAIHAQLYSGKDDVYMHFNLPKGALQIFVSALSDGKISLDVPPYTTMDDKYEQAMKLLNSGLSYKDIPLARDLVAEIKQLGSAGKAIDLYTWSLTVKEGSPDFKNATDKTKQMFEYITSFQP